MNILELFFIVIVFYLAYLILGCAVLYMIDDRLGEWVYNAPNNFLFVTAWTFWPFAIIVYYVLRFRKD